MAVAAARVGLLLALAGCSAVLAVSPYKGPELGVFGVGSTSEEVERVLGRPLSSSTNADGGRTAIYEYSAAVFWAVTGAAVWTM